MVGRYRNEQSTNVGTGGGLSGATPMDAAREDGHLHAQRHMAFLWSRSHPFHRYCLHRQAYRWTPSPFWRLVLIRRRDGGGVDDSARCRGNETAYNDASERDTCHRR
jgi:hypothetical protein